MFYVGEFFYYSINLSAILLGWYWIGKKLSQMGYERKRLTLYVLSCMLFSFPVGFASSRAVGMFYHPASQWSLEFFFDNMFNGKTHTFHGSLIMPILLYLIYGLIYRIKILHLLDTVFLYIPLGHAIGRVSCMIVGCCWGHSISLNLFGLNLTFQNPTPLWAIGMNLCIYYFLKRLHTYTYFNPTPTRNYSGAVSASYLILYGVDRFFMEIFRTERVVFQGLTQAQFTMLVFMSIGLVILAYLNYARKADAKHPLNPVSFSSTAIPLSNGLIGFFLVNIFLLSIYYLYQIYSLLFMLIFQKPKIAFADLPPIQLTLLFCLTLVICSLVYVKYFKHTAKSVPADPSAAPADTSMVPEDASTPPSIAFIKTEIKPLALLASYTAITLFLLSLFYYLVMKMRILPFPFQRVRDVSTAYKLILTYLPFLVLPILSILWLKEARLPIWEKFKISGNPKTIIIFTTIGLLASILYSVDLLVIREPRLRGLAFWPPVLILSVINAFTEEIAYRLTAYSLLLNANFSRITAILLQAILYSSVHFFFNPTLGVLSLLYGIIMGLLMDRTQSVTLCIICHFIIDLGAIGRPILAF